MIITSAQQSCFSAIYPISKPNYTITQDKTKITTIQLARVKPKTKEQEKLQANKHKQHNSKNKQKIANKRNKNGTIKTVF